jgi:hypothetical protein
LSTSRSIAASLPQGDVSTVRGEAHYARRSVRELEDTPFEGYVPRDQYAQIIDAALLDEDGWATTEDAVRFDTAHPVPSFGTRTNAAPAEAGWIARVPDIEPNLTLLNDGRSNRPHGAETDQAATPLEVGAGPLAVTVYTKSRDRAS